MSDPSDIPDRLAMLMAAVVEQARIDRTPCPTCGGDRLRADFVTPGRCHVPRTPAPAWREGE